MPIPKEAKSRESLQVFDFSLVQPQMKGLSFNIERDLNRRMEAASCAKDMMRVNELSLIYLFNQFATNAHNAVIYLTANSDEDRNRKPSYVVVVPAILRQLLDLLFSVVYMFDDYDSRMKEYDSASYRSAVEDMVRYQRFAADPDMKKYLDGRGDLLNQIAAMVGIPPNERKEPQKIEYWPTPTKIKDKKTRSRSFLRWLYKWLYSDTSEQAHLSSFGLHSMGGLLMKDLANDEQKELLEQRLLPQFHAAQVTRTAVVALAIMSEIDNQFGLGNKSQATYIWSIFAQHNEEAKDMYDQRYRSLLMPSGG